MKFSKKPEVILLYPKTGLDLGTALSPPHSLLAIAAPAVKKGYNVCILDQRVKKITESSLANLISNDLICFGVSTMTGTQIRNALSLTTMIRKLTKAPIVWGGVHPTVMPEQTLVNENVDIITIGEADQTFVELIYVLEHRQPLQDVPGIMYKDGLKQIMTKPRALMDVEELLPTPWELLDVEKYIHKNKDMYLKGCSRVLDLGQTSRGCPFKCGFCSSASIRGRRWRPMSVEKSMDLIKDGVKRFKLDGFWLRDDEFYIDRQRVHSICDGILRENMKVKFYTAGTRIDVFMKASHQELVTLKQSGAYMLKFGAESGSQRILDLMQKGITVEQTLAANRRCREYNFIPAFTLMIGYPTETFAEINMTIDLAYRLKKENPNAHIETITAYTAHPGTPDFKLAIEHGLRPPNFLEGWTNWILDDYDLKGEKLPWFNEKERLYIGNISYMSILADSIEGIVRNFGMSNKLVTRCAALFGQYFHLRLKNKMYKCVPELRPIRFLRHKLFYNNSEPIDRI